MELLAVPRLASPAARLVPLLGLDLVHRLMHEEDVTVPRWNELDALLDEVRRLYKEDRILKADEKMRQLAETMLRIERRPETAPPLSSEDVTRLDTLVNGLEELAHIHLEAIELRRMIQDAKATASWQTISSTPTSVCSYRPDPSSPCHWIRSSGTVRAPLLNIIALINEVDLYKTWIPFLKFAREIGGQGIRKAVHLSIDLPWPISERELLIFGYSADDLDDSGCVYVFMRDCTPEDLSLLSPSLASPLTPSLVRARIRLAGLVLRPLTPTETEVTMLANVDPCLASMPYWLLNFATRNAMPMMFSLFSSLASNIEGSEHSKRIQQKSDDFYAEVRGRLAARGWGQK